MNPAHNGADALVPANTSVPPLLSRTQMLSAVSDTSGRSRETTEPLLEAMLTPFCHDGRLYCGLTPPLLPPKPNPTLYQFHVASETQLPPGPLVLSTVPPTLVTLGSSE